MILIIHLIFLFFLSFSSAKITYFNLENTYGPYCNAEITYTPDAGVVRYAGTPWTGKCELNLQSCCSPSVMTNLSSSTRFYFHLLKPPFCLTENVFIQSETGETIVINCNATDGSEYYLNTERIKIIYYRTVKFPISNFAMVVTPLKIKTRMYSVCGFDCFTDTYCIDRSLVCDRFKNCPNNLDEAHCDYNIHRPPISFRSKIILFTVLLIIISFDVCSILICYFCCGISNRNRTDLPERKLTIPSILEEGGAVLLQRTNSKNNNQTK